MKLSRLSLILPLLAVAACDQQAAEGPTPKPVVAHLDNGATVVAAPTADGDAVIIATPPPGAGGTAAPATAAGRLGTTVASLGNAAEPGMWIKTPLVTAPGKGRLVNPATGRAANVDLIPLGGPATGGSQVSLPALQALGASLTDLPTIEVWRS
ncbi:hypothetical protein KTN05_01180 [Paracoccus sp. Z118]|uniref:hypothetical protein n=1 Tax=Paracoccus sp. Z118 TaxID=2851017 RepID=UPI001C2C2134|nr:hypothetical protein [Paracoccus sp. Z118]MBV0890463.1 hypothetical protein [Paracoccus sp. Z118]